MNNAYSQLSSAMTSHNSLHVNEYILILNLTSVFHWRYWWIAWWIFHDWWWMLGRNCQIHDDHGI